MKTKPILKKIIMALTTALLLVCCIIPDAVIAADYNARVTVSQVYTETEAPEGKVFKYILKPAGAGPVAGFAVSGAGALTGGLNSGAYEFSIDGSADIDLIYTGLPGGTYQYTLECVPDERADIGYEFDSRKYDIYIYADTGASDATVVIKDQNGNKPDSAGFTHSYGEADPFIAVDPPVRKRINGNPTGKSTFRFRLRAVENTAGYALADQPMPEGSSNGAKYMNIEGAAIEEFGWWTYTKAGRYTYDISEVNTGLEDYEFDTNMYTITDEVTRVDGQFAVQRKIVDAGGRVVQSTLIESNSDEKAVNVEFINTYTGGSGDDDDGGTGSDDGNGDGDGDDDGSSTNKDNESGLRRLIPKTGDAATVLLWIVILGAAILMIGVIRSRRRSRDNSGENL